MLFSPSLPIDTNLVIVPPKPDVHQDEFSYDTLYSYGEGYVPSLVSLGSSISSGSVSNDNAAPQKGTSCTSSNYDMQLTEIANANSFNQPVDDTQADERSLANSLLLKRNPKNGAFTFQVHAEYDLLLHVQKDLDRRKASSTSADITAELEPARIIMKSIDNYCLRKQWMYHIGYEKAVAVRSFLQRSLHDFIARNSEALHNGKKMQFTAVDLGTYCGYSALVMCHAIRSLLLDMEALGDMRAKYVEFEVVTTEISSKLINVAQSLFRLGKMDKFVTCILVKDGDLLSQVIQTHFSNGDGMKNQIDFLLLDHKKAIYLTDLMDLESHNMLRSGSYVAADNVIFNQLDSYRHHMAKQAKAGIVETRLVEVNLEYSNNLKDGIGENIRGCCF